MRITQSILQRLITIRITIKAISNTYTKTESSIGKISVDPHVIKLLKNYKVDVQDTWKNELYVDNNFVLLMLTAIPRN